MKSGIECAAVLAGVMGVAMNVSGVPGNISSRAPLTYEVDFGGKTWSIPHCDVSPLL